MHWCLGTGLTPKVDMKPLWLATLAMSDFLQVSPLAPCFLTGGSFMTQVYPAWGWHSCVHTEPSTKENMLSWGFWCHAGLSFRGLSHWSSEPTYRYICTSQLNKSSGQRAQTGHMPSIQLTLPIDHGGHIWMTSWKWPLAWDNPQMMPRNCFGECDLPWTKNLPGTMLTVQQHR